MKTACTGALLVLLLALAGASARAADVAASLDELLGYVKQGRATAAQEAAAREQRFTAEQATQRAELDAALAALAEQQRRADALERRFAANAAQLTAQEHELGERLGAMKAVFAELGDAARTMRARFEGSITTAQLGAARLALLDRLQVTAAGGDTLPELADLQAFWYEMQREVTATGRVERFDASVLMADGASERLQVVRIGAFNTVTADGDYLQYLPRNGLLAERSRPVPGNAPVLAARLAAATAGSLPVALDPTGADGASLLDTLTQMPTPAERLRAGGWPVLVIALLAVAGLALAVRAWFRHDTYVRYEHIPAVLGFLALLAVMFGVLGCALAIMRDLDQGAIRGIGDSTRLAHELAVALVPAVAGAAIAILLLLARGAVLAHAAWHEAARVAAE